MKRELVKQEKLKRAFCVDCNLAVVYNANNDNTTIFDFDHKNRKDKIMVRDPTKSVEDLVKEMAKCDIRNSDCHIKGISIS